MFELNQAEENSEDASGLHQSLIMMVDDEPLNLEIIQLYLENAGYKNFINIDQSSRALGVIAEEKPDILLLDLDMPEVTGFDILKEMRRDEELKHIPVLVLTSSTDSKTKLQALEYGATDFLSKPVDSSELILRLRNTLFVKAYQDQLAYYDQLTGLPNRRLFLDRTNWAISNARRTNKSVAILYIDMDQFSDIKTSFGSHVGDAICQEAALRICDSIRDSDVVSRADKDSLSSLTARVAAGDFTIMLPGIVHMQIAEGVCRRVLSAMSHSFYIEGQEYFISINIGIAGFPADGERADELFSKAESANHYARQHSNNSYQYYANDMNVRSAERLKLENHLRRAIDKNELYTQYQPKISTITGNVAGMEALLRWNNHELGIVSPDEFITIAESTGLIVDIGKWILNDACSQASKWHDEGLVDLSISVNVSGEQFKDSKFVDIVKDALRESGLKPSSLVLELTESMIMGNEEANISTLHELKSLGISLSIDDFGTGYSSLSYLSSLPIDELKIDKSFIVDVTDNDNSAAIVSAIIAMAHALNLKVVAEGIEEEKQLNFLKQRNCDQIQGFYYSSSLSKDEFPDFVEMLSEQ